MSFSNPQILSSAGTDVLPKTTGPSPSSQGASATFTPTIWLDSYYDNPIFVSKTAAMQAAINAAIASRATLECEAGRIYQEDTGRVSIPPNSPLIIEGHGASWQANYGNSIQVLNFQRNNDYDTFTNVTIRDLTFDANNQPYTGTPSVVGPGNSQRINIQHVHFENCRCINIPTSNSVLTATFGFTLGSIHLNSGETQTNLIDLRFEKCIVSGGNFGVTVIGSCSNGLQAVNVYHDQIFVDVQHNTNTVPTNFAGGAHVQVGSLGWGDYCEVKCIGFNSWDVGVEIDGMQTAHIWGRVTDAWNAEYYFRNFNSPPDLNSQKYHYHDCRAVVQNLNPTIGGASACGFKSSTGSAPDPTFGEVVFENCSVYSTAANFQINGQGFDYIGSTVRTITVIGTFDVILPNVNDVSGHAPLVNIFGPNTAGTTTIRGPGKFRTIVGGTVTGTTAVRFNAFLPVAAATILFDSIGFIGGSSLAGINPGNTQCFRLGVGAGGTFGGRCSYIGWESFSGSDTTPALTSMPSSANNAIDHNLTIDVIDLRKDPAAAPAVLGVGGSDATNKAKFLVSRALTPTYPLAGSAIAVGGSPFTYQNLDCYEEEIYTVGGTVTSITYTPNGQAAVSTGSVTGPIRVRPGDSLVVTYTAAPTMNKIPVL